MIGEVRDDRVDAQRGNFGNDVWHDHHVGGVADERRGGAVVRVIVVGTVSQNQIGAVTADERDQLEAGFHRWLQPPIAIVQDFVLNPHQLRDGLRLCQSQRRQLGGPPRLMSCFAVGHADKLHVVPRRAIQRGDASGFDLAVIGVSTNYKDAERSGCGHEVPRNEMVCVA